MAMLNKFRIQFEIRPSYDDFWPLLLGIPPAGHQHRCIGACWWGGHPPPAVHLPVRFNFPLPQAQRLQAPDVSVSSGKHHCVPETALTHKTTDECPLTWTLTPCVLILKKNHFLVDGFNSSEDISQLGWLFPIYAKKFQTTNQVQITGWFWAPQNNQRINDLGISALTTH